MEEWTPADNIREDLLEMINNVKRHYQGITTSKVAQTCNDAAKIMSLIQSYKKGEITTESLLLEVNQLISLLDSNAQTKVYIEYISENLAKIINSYSDKMEIDTNFWDYYVSYC